MLKFSKVIKLSKTKNIFSTYKNILKENSKEKLYVIIEDGKYY